MQSNKLRLFPLLSLFLLLAAISLPSHAQTRVTTEWLAKHRNDANLVLIDMDADLQYQRFHIPGAVHLPYPALNVRTRRGVSLSLGRDDLIKLLGMLGANADSQIIIYDDLGGLNAARLYWELERLGHERFAVLDGGLVQWILDGRKVTNQETVPKKTTYTPRAGKTRDNVATLAEVSKPASGTVLLDVRSEQEYSGHPRQPRSGHIPGAKWWPWNASVDFEKAFVMKPAGELKASLGRLGIKDPHTPLILYCQSGHRASQAYYTLRQLGFDKVRVYDGSMAEYAQHKELPLKKGMQP